jgi:hypothetical protein
MLHAGKPHGGNGRGSDRMLVAIRAPRGRATWWPRVSAYVDLNALHHEPSAISGSPPASLG